MSCTAVATNTVWKAGHRPQCECGLHRASICWWPQYFPNPRSALASRLRVLGGRSHLDGLSNHDRCFNHICTEPYVIDEVGMNYVCKYTFSLSTGLFYGLVYSFRRLHIFYGCIGVCQEVKKIELERSLLVGEKWSHISCASIGAYILIGEFCHTITNSN